MKYICTYKKNGLESTTKIFNECDKKKAIQLTLFGEPMATDIEAFSLYDKESNHLFYEDLKALFGRLEDSNMFGSIERNLHEFSDKYVERLENL